MPEHLAAVRAPSFLATAGSDAVERVAPTVAVTGANGQVARARVGDPSRPVTTFGLELTPLGTVWK